jgi:hypothetical protein
VTLTLLFLMILWLHKCAAEGDQLMTPSIAIKGYRGVCTVYRRNHISRATLQSKGRIILLQLWSSDDCEDVNSIMYHKLRSSGDFSSTDDES